MKALYYIAVAEIVAYLALTIFRFKKIPKSISDTYYQWSQVGNRFLFTAVMWAVGLPILIYWLSVSKTDLLQCCAFLSICGMLFVGGASAFKETLTKAVHFTSAGIWAFFAVLYFVLVGYWIALTCGGAVFFLVALILDNRHFTFWAEVACIVAMIVGIFNL